MCILPGSILNYIVYSFAGLKALAGHPGAKATEKFFFLPGYNEHCIFNIHLVSPKKERGKYSHCHFSFMIFYDPSMTSMA